VGFRGELTDFARTVHILDREHRTEAVQQKFGEGDDKIGIGDENVHKLRPEASGERERERERERNSNLITTICRQQQRRMQMMSLVERDLPSIDNVETRPSADCPVVGDLVQLIHQHLKAFFGHIRAAALLKQI
jgi:hypothetical protein